MALSEVGYGAWMAVSLERWWRTAPQAELARRGIDLLHDIKPALLAMERYKDVARPLYDMIEVSAVVRWCICGWSPAQSPKNISRLRAALKPVDKGLCKCLGTRTWKIVRMVRTKRTDLSLWSAHSAIDPVWCSRNFALPHLLYYNLFSLQEVEREAPNNAFVIIIFGALGAVLQVASDAPPDSDMSAYGGSSTTCCLMQNVYP